MYKISVPVMLETIDRSDREKLLSQLRGLDAERVFLALGSYTLDPAKRAQMCEKLKKEAAFFKAEGFEVGCWLWTFMLGEPNGFMKQCGLDGKSFPTPECCPSDDAFVDFACGYVADLARTGVELIMFDDDFRHGEFTFKIDGCSAGCGCKNHRAYMEKLIGKPLPEPEELGKLVFTGGNNEYRSAMMKANAHYMKRFAARVREAVDAVNPSVRVGVCACMSLWDQDGVSADEISRILAGGTKPFLRLIGAPYWAARNSSLGKRLQYIIELERTERSWVTDPEIEIFSEGDAYPRPRYACPASYLEAFDMILRADGRLDGILKYGVDYCSSAGYEDGYVLRHIAHRDAYRAIDEMFSGKAGAGVRLYCNKDIIENAEIPEAVRGSSAAQYLFFPDENKLFSTLSVPTVYEGRGVCGAAFGEHAKYLDKAALDGGLILDAAAAKFLTRAGADVGLEKYGVKLSVGEEYFSEYNEYTPSKGEAVRLTLKDGAQVMSEYKDGAPAAYRYENADGQRFFVLCFEAAFNDERMWRHYAKARQIADAVEWLSGKKLPAHYVGAPDLYILTKEGGGKLAVGLWNLSPDDVTDPTLTLGDSYTHARFFGCGGSLDGDKLALSRIEPFGFCFVELQ